MCPAKFAKVDLAAVHAIPIAILPKAEPPSPSRVSRRVPALLNLPRGENGAIG